MIFGVTILSMAVTIGVAEVSCVDVVFVSCFRLLIIFCWSRSDPLGWGVLMAGDPFPGEEWWFRAFKKLRSSPLFS